MSGTFGLALGAAGIAGGGALLPLLIIGGMGATAASLNMASEFAKDGGHQKTATVLGHTAKAATFGGWGGFLGRMFGRSRTKKERQDAERVLSGRESNEKARSEALGKEFFAKDHKDYGDLRDAAAFEGLSKDLREAELARDRADKKVLAYGAAGAVAGSIAGGTAVGLAFGHHGPHQGQGHESGSVGKPGHGHETTQQHSEAISAHIKYRGEGADKLYADLREQISVSYRHAHQGAPPPLVDKLLGYKNWDDFSRATGFEHVVRGADLHGPNPHVDSAVMHMAENGRAPDTFTLSADRTIFSYTDPRGVEHVVLHQTPQGTIETPMKDIPMRDYSHLANQGSRPDASDALNSPQVEAAPQPSADDATGAAEAAAPAAPAETAPAAPSPESVPEAHFVPLSERINRIT